MTGIAGAQLLLGFGAGVTDAWFVFLGLAAVGWLAFFWNRSKKNHAECEFKLMGFVSVYAILASAFGHLLGAFMPFLIGVEAFGIAPILANTFSCGVASFLTGFHSFGSPVPDFSPARHARKTGRTGEAIELALAELEKDPLHYEGNYLLAEIFWEQRNAPFTLFCLFRILDNPRCTEAQRGQIQAELDNAIQLARQRGWLPVDATTDQIRNSLPQSLGKVSSD